VQGTYAARKPLMKNEMRGTGIARKTRAPKKGKPADGNSVRTVRVTVQVLDALARFREPARITDLARQLKMTLPRVSRHVATLRSLGFIEKAEPLEAYRLGAKLFSLGQAALQQNSLASVAHPHLLRLRDQVRRTVLLSTPAPGGTAVLMCLDSGEPTTIVVQPGTILEFPQSPAARVVFAFTMSAGEGLPSSGMAQTLMDYSEVSRKQLEAKVAQILRDYCDFSSDARNTGIGAVAVPVFNHQNRITGAVSVLALTAALGNHADPQLVSASQTCASRISAALGSTMWDRMQKA
jgi:DNA-binding IclR family transcriptional regulator